MNPHYRRFIAGVVGQAVTEGRAVVPMVCFHRGGLPAGAVFVRRFGDQASKHAAFTEAIALGSAVGADRVVVIVDGWYRQAAGDEPLPASLAGDARAREAVFVHDVTRTSASSFAWPYGRDDGGSIDWDSPVELYGARSWIADAAGRALGAPMPEPFAALYPGLLSALGHMVVLVGDRAR